LKIECYISQGCSSLEQLKANIELALKKGDIEAEAHYYRISDEKAVEMKLTRSPTILINCKDISPGGSLGFS
jgi:hypothetical protein